MDPEQHLAPGLSDQRDMGRWIPMSKPAEPHSLFALRSGRHADMSRDDTGSPPSPRRCA
jgi:hypothetical protein